MCLRIMKVRDDLLAPYAEWVWRPDDALPDQCERLASEFSPPCRWASARSIMA